jgi:hypothetical protein
MSLLQEMEKFGLADCAFNRQLIRNERRLTRLINIYLPVFNDQQEHEGDLDMCLTKEQATKSFHFWYWCETWGDSGRRGELADLLRGTK